MINLCKTCITNTESFPLIRCLQQPFGEQGKPTTECKWYLDGSMPSVYIFFKYSDGTILRGLNLMGGDNLVEYTKIYHTKLKGKRPIAASVIAHGPFTDIQKQQFKDLFFKWVCKSLHPTKNKKIYGGIAKELLGVK